MMVIMRPQTSLAFGISLRTTGTARTLVRKRAPYTALPACTSPGWRPSLGGIGKKSCSRADPVLLQHVSRHPRLSTRNVFVAAALCCDAVFIFSDFVTREPSCVGALREELLKPVFACLRPYDRSEFPWLRELEEAAPDITREMKSLARAGGERSYRGGTGEMSTVYDATQGWGTMRIRYMGRCAAGSRRIRFAFSQSQNLHPALRGVLLDVALSVTCGRIPRRIFEATRLSSVPSPTMPSCQAPALHYGSWSQALSRHPRRRRGFYFLRVTIFRKCIEVRERFVHNFSPEYPFQFLPGARSQNTHPPTT